ncbi:MAG: alpha-hydroxy-acid oxidizing protein [Hyphomicrobiales bacterium]|nr:alpha-hydroxy-acid oxidizing protein [Hyphomicrobiales bacterium]MBV8439407.1 alpha-hydroxy-acid oxidizing protein [Hyphomicrobiales bacterium]
MLSFLHHRLGGRSGRTHHFFDLEPTAEKIIPKPYFAYISSGLATKWTQRENTRAFYDRRILPQCLAGVDEPDTRTQVLGTPVDVPIFVAPTAALRLAHVSAEKGTAEGRGGCRRLVCVPTLPNFPLEEIRAASPTGP